MSGVKDFGESSKYYTDQYKDAMKDIEKEKEAIEKSKKTIMWIQEFSKKVTTAIFISYLAVTIFSCVMIYLSMKATGVTTGLEIMISEINTTFRDVVGGYLIKAGIENAVKIGGNYYVGVADAKLKALRERLQLSNDCDDNFDTAEDFSDNN
jgi:hypothetical protein